ncbi:MAG: ATP-binding cassette domain-containing protein [Spirochaetales bacterium]|nr:ATP-binding cassette domain-containing protein [Spirochaetales bacterium]
MIEFKTVSFCYDKSGDKGEKTLDNVSFAINDGSFFGITGNMGSGKTTLCKLICGLLKPTSGQIRREGSIAFAMQFPESQLFESTVLKDVLFGPLNRGLGKEQALEVAKRSLDLVGIDQDLYERSPLSISGGEKRRVALAGVLAMQADVLVLDEPAAGLDGVWHDELFRILHNLNDSEKTVVVVSHDMDDIAENCSDLLVLEEGCIKDNGKAGDVLSRQTGLETNAMEFAERLKNCGFGIDPKKAVTIGSLADLVVKAPR